jgi:hypothetical protein
MERIEKRKYPYPKTTFHDEDTHNSPKHDDDMSSLTNSFNITPRTPPRNIKKNIPVSPLTPNTPVNDEPKPPKDPYPGTNRPMHFPELKFPEIPNPEIPNKKLKKKKKGGKKKTKKTKKNSKKKNKTNKRKHKKRNTRKK